MDVRGIVPDVAPDVVRFGVQEVVEAGATKWATALGARRVASRFTEALLRNALRQMADNGTVSAGSAVVRAGFAVQGVRATVSTVAPVVGKLAGGALAGPAAELVGQLFDGERHTPGDRVKAAGRGLASGLAGAAGTAGTAALVGATIGSAVPLFGTIAGFAVGTAVSTAVGSVLKPS